MINVANMVRLNRFIFLYGPGTNKISNHSMELIKASTVTLTFLASINFCHLGITFANKLNPDQDQQNVGPDLDPNCLTL